MTEPQTTNPKFRQHRIGVKRLLERLDAKLDGIDEMLSAVLAERQAAAERQRKQPEEHTECR